MDDDFHLLGNFLKLQICLFSHIVDKSQRGLSGDRAEPRLIFKAIAIFYMNNLCRSRSALPLWERQVIPGIVMVGIAPTFHRITVTTALIDVAESANQDVPNGCTGRNKLAKGVSYRRSRLVAGGLNHERSNFSTYWWVAEHLRRLR